MVSELYRTTVGGCSATLRHGRSRSYSSGLQQKRALGRGSHLARDLITVTVAMQGTRASWNDASTRPAKGFASCRVTLGGCPWAFSAYRTNGRRRHHHRHGRSFHRDRSRHHPGHHHDCSDPEEARRNRDADAEAGADLQQYPVASHVHRDRVRGTSRLLEQRALLLRTVRMRTPWGGPTRGPLECERQLPRRFVRRAHVALRRSLQS